MYPVIDPKNFEGHGDGFGVSSPQEVAELNKALEAGVAKVGDTLAFVAFGAGLTWGSAVVRLVEREVPPPTGIWQLPIFRWFSRNR